LQLKTKRKNGGENKVRWNHHGGVMQKSEFFVTGEVFLVDIGLLMGATDNSIFLLDYYRTYTT